MTYQHDSRGGDDMGKWRVPPKIQLYVLLSSSGPWPMPTHPLTPIANLGQYLPPSLGQPQNIAVLLSLVFHGVLFAAGPSFSSLQMARSRDNSVNQSARQVPMVELTAEEQNRLPDFDSFAYSLTPSQGDESQPLPGLNDLPGSVTTPPQPLDPLSNLALPKAPLGSSSLGISPLPSSLGRSLFLPAPPLLPRRSTPDNRPTDTDRAIAADLARRSQQNPPTPMPSPATPPNQAANPNADNNPADSNPGGANGLADRYTDLRARLQHSTELTTDAEVSSASQAWLQSVAESLGETPLTAASDPLTVDISYDLRICLTPPPTPGLVGLVRLPAEESDSPEISTTTLKSTGYPFLNETALDAIKAQAAAADPPLSVGTLYQVVVNVNYDAKTCLSAETLLKSRQRDTPTNPAAPSPEGSMPMPSPSP